MGTTSFGIALTAVTDMLEAGVDLALIHGLESMRSGKLSDLDIVIDQPAGAAMRIASDSWAASGLYPVVLWPYDVGGTASIFLTTADASEGVQLDCLYDPLGHGRYGIRSDALLQPGTRRSPIPTIPDSLEVVYLWRKRVLKGQIDRMQGLRDAAQTIGERAVRDASIALTGGTETAQQLLGRLVACAHRRPITARQKEAARKVGRLFSPIGYWAHVRNIEIGRVVARRFDRFLRRTRLAGVPEGREFSWYLQEIWPTLLRPGVFISYGAPPEKLKPALVSASSPEAAATAIVRGMSTRLLSCRR